MSAALGRSAVAADAIIHPRSVLKLRRFHRCVGSDMISQNRMGVAGIGARCGDHSRGARASRSSMGADGEPGSDRRTRDDAVARIEPGDRHGRDHPATQSGIRRRCRGDDGWLAAASRPDREGAGRQASALCRAQRLAGRAAAIPLAGRGLQEAAPAAVRCDQGADRHARSATGGRPAGGAGTGGSQSRRAQLPGSPSLSTTQAAVNSANLRIDRQLSAIEDMRRQNFASALLQPVPPSLCLRHLGERARLCPWAVRQLGDMVATWWKSVSDPAEIVRSARRSRHHLSRTGDSGPVRRAAAAALAGIFRAAILAPRVVRRRRHPAARAPGRGAGPVLLWRDRRRPGVCLRTSAGCSISRRSRS